MRVLIVDENVNIRVMLRQLLRGLCDEILECASGEEAVIVYKRWHPDVVLTEILLPRMDGIETMQAIQCHDPGVHLLFVTEVDEPSCRSEALAAGAEGYFLKENLIELQDYIMQQPALH